MITALFRKRFSELTKGESAEEISNNTELTPEYVKGLLKGERYPDIFDLYSIADSYNVTTDYLLGRTEEKEPAPAAAGQAHKEISNTNNIAQSEEVVKNFTYFPPILLEFAQQHFGDIEVQRIFAFDDITAPDNLKRAEIEFTDCTGNRYRIRVDGIKEEDYDQNI